jgi:hypothetical protein
VDIREEDGIPVFDINDTGEKKRKSVVFVCTKTEVV